MIPAPQRILHSILLHGIYFERNSFFSFLKREVRQKKKKFFFFLLSSLSSPAVLFSLRQSKDEEPFFRLSTFVFPPSSKPPTSSP